MVDCIFSSRNHICIRCGKKDAHIEYQGKWFCIVCSPRGATIHMTITERGSNEPRTAV